jgi:hypothetical protein
VSHGARRLEALALHASLNGRILWTTPEVLTASSCDAAGVAIRPTGHTPPSGSAPSCCGHGIERRSVCSSQLDSSFSAASVRLITKWLTAGIYFIVCVMLFAAAGALWRASKLR